MKFSKRSYPILDKKNAKELFKFQEAGFTEKMVLGNISGQIVKHCDLVIKRDVDFLTVPFFNKIMERKLFKQLSNLYKDLEQCEGVLLLPKKYFSKVHAISYIIFPYNMNGKNTGVTIDFLLYSDDGIICKAAGELESELINLKSAVSINLKMHEGHDLAGWVNDYAQILLAAITFKQYAEIETFQIGGKDYPKKIKKEETKYFNDTGSTVNVLDSSWYTTTVRSEGFDVRGFFRLQPFGKGLKKRKLKWINDFRKNGYTRKARKEIKQNSI